MSATVRIFGGGSLINRQSLARTINRLVPIAQSYPCRLREVQRSFGVADRMFSQTLAKEVRVAWIDLRDKAGSNANGIVYEVDAHEFNLLKARESNYAARPVGSRIEYTGPVPIGRDCEVYAFFSKPQDRVSTGQEDVYVLREYMETIRDGCLAVSNAFHEEFTRTTVPCPFPLLDEPYLRRG